MKNKTTWRATQIRSLMGTPAATRQQTRLDQIAVQMRQAVARPGEWTRYKMAHGLDIILHHTDDVHWRLAAAREGAYPSVSEIEVLRERFGVPFAAEETRSQKYHTHPKTGRRIAYHVVEIIWRQV